MTIDAGLRGRSADASMTGSDPARKGGLAADGRRRNRPVRKSRNWIPWTDRSGHFSPLKTAILALSAIPAGLLVVQWLTDNLGPEPAKAAVHASGLWTIRFLLLTLAVTPLRHLGYWPRVSLLRRQLGLTTLCYAIAHLALYAIWQDFDLSHIAAEIALRVYLTIGFAALVGLCVLGITSTDGWLRRLKHNWKRLHRIVFLIAILGSLHFFMQAKVDVGQAVMLAGFLLWLLTWRLLPVKSHLSFPVLLALAPATALATALLEFTWYGVATGVDPMRVLQANLSFAAGIRPAIWAGLAALTIAAVAGRTQRAVYSLAPMPRVAASVEFCAAAMAGAVPTTARVVQTVLVLSWLARYGRWHAAQADASRPQTLGGPE